jgi:hypothetical protein
VRWGYFKTGGQSAPLSDLLPDITSFRYVAVWNLLSCFCGEPSLMRGRVWIIQWSQSRKTRNQTLLPRLRLPQPGGPGSRIYIPSYTPGNWVVRYCLVTVHSLSIIMDSFTVYLTMLPAAQIVHSQRVQWVTNHAPERIKWISLHKLYSSSLVSIGTFLRASQNESPCMLH